MNEELGAQTQITKDFGKEAPKAVGDFANNRIKAIIADTTLSNAEKNEAIAKWDEGGIYRVAAHTALGALGTGSVEGALTTGGVAAAAPTLDDVQAKLAKALIDKGMSEDIANGTASGVVSLTLLGAGTAAGLDTSSTVTATNIDANNRQLHPSEIKQLKRRAKLLSKGNKGLEEYWLNLLYGAAYAKVDAQGNKKYGQYKQGINNGVDASSQLGASLGDAYLADYKKAESIINEMSKNAKGIVYLKDNKGNRITDNKGNNIGFLNADNNQYNYNTLLTNTYPPSPPNGGTSLRSNDPRRNLGTALESQTRAAAGQVANVGSGATTPIHPEDYALLGYGAAKTVTNIAKNRIAKGAAAKASKEIIPQEYRTQIDNKVKIVQKDESLPSFVKDSFKDGNYRTVVTNEDIVVYRVYGGNAKAEGGFVTTSPANNKIQAKIDAALLPEWKNTRRFEAEIIIPKGTTINVGRVEEQTIRESGTVLKGDVDQILMPKDWPSSWIKSTRKVKP